MGRTDQGEVWECHTSNKPLSALFRQRSVSHIGHREPGGDKPVTRAGSERGGD